VTGVSGQSSFIGVAGLGLGSNRNGIGIGVRGTAGGNIDENILKTVFPVGVKGESAKGIGVEGFSYEVWGLEGISIKSQGIYGETSGDKVAVILGITVNKNAVGVSGVNTNGGTAGYFKGKVYVDGNVNVTGNINKSALFFQLDHPLDPGNKYLNHSSIESSEMKNLYDGVITLDDRGEAEVDLPDWFGALNQDFRYHLTAIGSPGPNLHIAKEITETNTNYNNNKNLFKIAGGIPGMKVSWQVTGVRKDPYAKAHPIQVEEVKSDGERGYYIHPDLYGQGSDKGISHLAVSAFKK